MKKIIILALACALLLGAVLALSAIAAESPSEKTNVALGKPVKPGKSERYRSNSPATDGVLYTTDYGEWLGMYSNKKAQDVSVSESTSCFIEVDLEALYEIHELYVLATEDDRQIVKWLAFASDDNTKPLSGWTALGGKQDTERCGREASRWISFEPTEARYVRIYPTYYSYTTVYIEELMVYSGGERYTPVYNDLFDEAKAVNGYYSNGNIVSNNDRFASELIPVNGSSVSLGKINKNNYNGFSVIECFDSSKKYISGISLSELTINRHRNDICFATASLPKGTAYVGVNVHKNDFNHFVLTENTEITVEGYYKHIGEAIPHVVKNSALDGLSVGFFGSNIMSAQGEAVYSPINKDIVGIHGRLTAYGNLSKGTNYAKNDSNLAKYNEYPLDGPGRDQWITASYWVGDQIAKASSHDIFILLAGETDAEGNVPTGEMSTSYNASDFDLKTYAGALEYAFAKMREKNPNAVIGYIICYELDRNGGAPGRLGDMKAYNDVAKAICKKWGVNCLDLYEDKELAQTLGKKMYDLISWEYDALYSKVEAWAFSLAEEIPSGEHTHEYAEYIDVAAASCKSEGTQSAICKHCNNVVTKTSSSSGHNYENGVCTDCGYKGVLSKGDLDENNTVNGDDAIYLLMSIFYSEEYPLNQACDFDGDGRVTENDATRLLMYSFFPSEYSLK